MRIWINDDGVFRERERGLAYPRAEIFFTGKDYLPLEEVEELFGLTGWDKEVVSSHPPKVRFIAVLPEIVYEYIKLAEDDSRVILPIKEIIPEKVGQILKKHRKAKDPGHPLYLRDVPGYREFVNFAKAFSSYLSHQPTSSLLQGETRIIKTR